MQLSILLFLQRIHAPFLDMAAEAASFTGEIILPLVLLCLIHWCISKKKSFAIAVPLLSAQYISQVLKAIIRYPRPFQVHPDLIEPGRLSTATGYSFPSGHSTLSGVFYSSLAVAGWKRWLTALCLSQHLLSGGFKHCGDLKLMEGEASDSLRQALHRLPGGIDGLPSEGLKARNEHNGFHGFPPW